MTFLEVNIFSTTQFGYHQFCMLHESRSNLFIRSNNVNYSIQNTKLHIFNISYITCNIQAILYLIQNCQANR